MKMKTEKKQIRDKQMKENASLFCILNLPVISKKYLPALLISNILQIQSRNGRPPLSAVENAGD